MSWFHDLVNTLLQWIESLGYFGILIGLAIEVIPSEIVLGYAGYLVYQHEISYWGAVLFGTIGAVVQQWILYGIGRWAGRPFFEKYGKFIKIKPKHLDLADQWFKRYGDGIVFTARFVPVMRQVISIPAGDRENALLAVYHADWACLYSMGASIRLFGPNAGRELGRHRCQSGAIRAASHSDRYCGSYRLRLI